MKTNQTIVQKSHSIRWKVTAALLAVWPLALISRAGDIPLRVTIEPVGAIASDGSGEYRNGENGVTAIFTAGQGRFSFDTGSSGGRKAYVDLGVGLAPGNYRIHFIIGRDHQDPNANDPDLRDPNWNDLDLDQLPIGRSTPVAMLFFVRTKQEGDWVVGFGDYPEATAFNFWPCNDATPAIVTRVDANAWTLEAHAAADHCLYWGGESGSLERIAFPLKMTLKRNPPQLKPLGRSATGFRLQVIGDPGGKVEVQGSGDFKKWDAVSSVTLGNAAAEVEDSTAAGHTQRFYRAVQSQ